MKHIAVVLLLMVLAATAWGMTRLFFFAPTPLATTATSEADDDLWRRTIDGWERLAVGMPQWTGFDVKLHPVIVALAELGFSFLALLALSSHHPRRQEQPRCEI